MPSVTVTGANAKLAVSLDEAVADAEALGFFVAAYQPYRDTTPMTTASTMSRVMLVSRRRLRAAAASASRWATSRALAPETLYGLLLFVLMGSSSSCYALASVSKSARRSPTGVGYIQTTAAR